MCMTWGLGFLHFLTFINRDSVAGRYGYGAMLVGGGGGFSAQLSQPLHRYSADESESMELGEGSNM